MLTLGRIPAHRTFDLDVRDERVLMGGWNM